MTFGVMGLMAAPVVAENVAMIKPKPKPVLPVEHAIIVNNAPAERAPIVVAENTLDEQKILKQIEDYIKSITTLKARFGQTAEIYSQDLTGTFSMQRPGKLRFEYDAPIDDYIVADGTFIYFYDSEMEHYTSAPVNSTMAAFLVRKDPGLTSEDIEVMDVADKDGLLGVTLRYADEPEKGRLTLIFKKEPQLQLLKWQIVDAQGYVTQIELKDVKTGMKIDRDTFVFVAPQISDPGYN